MAAQQDLQELLRILTTGRNKLPMLGAMSRIKTLQASNLRSLSDLAAADLATIKDAIGDERAAKPLQTAAKNRLKGPSKERGASDAALPDTKRKRSQYEIEDEAQTPQEYEAGLELPQPTADEEEISRTTIKTNRAPLVLAFAVALLRCTMPEQPLSSRLSLAQAVVSVNSRSKASSLGIVNGNSAEQDGWGQGQPKVRIMGREVHVLKRSGYEWKEQAVKSEEDVPEVQPAVKEEESGDRLEDEQVVKQEDNGEVKLDDMKWAVSQSVTLKKSTFIARSIGIDNPSQARSCLQQLMRVNPELRDASHNITAWRVRGEHGIIEDCNDDGESGGGRHILGLLQSMNLSNVFLVVTRWYGGIFLSTDRWRLMSEVARDSLSQRLRVTGTVGGEALWGLDLEVMRSNNSAVLGSASSGMPIHKPEAARRYIMKAFAAPTTKKTGVALEREKEHNLGLLLAALDLLFNSWADHIERDELDRRSWSWYVQVRPDVESGVAGWGGKGEVKLADILALRRKS